MNINRIQINITKFRRTRILKSISCFQQRKAAASGSAAVGRPAAVRGAAPCPEGAPRRASSVTWTEKGELKDQITSHVKPSDCCEKKILHWDDEGEMVMEKMGIEGR